jgi:hypothetical protein
MFQPNCANGFFVQRLQASLCLPLDLFGEAEDTSRRFTVGHGPGEGPIPFGFREQFGDLILTHSTARPKKIVRPAPSTSLANAFDFSVDFCIFSLDGFVTRHLR